MEALTVRGQAVGRQGEVARFELVEEALAQRRSLAFPDPALSRIASPIES
jgi:hypothetical protein